MTTKSVRVKTKRFWTCIRSTSETTLTMIIIIFYEDPEPKILTQVGLLNASVGSFLQLLLFIVMEPDARKYVKTKGQRYFQNETLMYFEKRTNRNAVNVSNKPDIFVIEL